MVFRNEFKEMNLSERYTYGGADLLPNGVKPKIFSIDNAEDLDVVILLSGDGDGNTLINMIAEEFGEFSINLKGYNAMHVAIADAIVDEFNEYENIEEAVNGIVSDFEMTKI